MNNMKVRAILAVLAGTVLNFACDWVLDARIDIFKGIATFNFTWMIDVFLVPFMSGFVVARIFARKGGKWLACLPPLFVRSLTFVYLYYFQPNSGQGFFFDLNLYYWGPCVILVVEAANFGGIIAEVLAGSYRRSVLASSENPEGENRAIASETAG